jgi:ABC-2 type transport system permease protein
VILAIVRRDFLVTRSYRLPFVLDLVFGVLNLAVFYFISQTFEEAGATPTELQGAPSYFAFAAVGIAITIVIDAATTSLASRIREEQLTGTLEALLVQPISPNEIAFGLAGFPFLFSMLRAVLYLVIAGVWLDVSLDQASWIGFVVVLVAIGATFSTLGILLGAIVLVIKRGQVLVGMLIFGMGLVGGAFFPIEVLPGWLEPIGRIVPTRFAFDGVRHAVFQGTGWERDAVALALFSVFGIPIALWIFRGALALGRRTGSLTQY